MYLKAFCYPAYENYFNVKLVLYLPWVASFITIFLENWLSVLWVICSKKRVFSYVGFVCSFMLDRLLCTLGVPIITRSRASPLVSLPAEKPQVAFLVVIVQLKFHLFLHVTHLFLFCFCCAYLCCSGVLPVQSFCICQVPCNLSTLMRNFVLLLPESPKFRVFLSCLLNRSFNFDSNFARPLSLARVSWTSTPCSRFVVYISWRKCCISRTVPSISSEMRFALLYMQIAWECFWHCSFLVFRSSNAIHKLDCFFWLFFFHSLTARSNFTPPSQLFALFEPPNYLDPLWSLTNVT